MRIPNNIIFVWLSRVGEGKMRTEMKGISRDDMEIREIQNVSDHRLALGCLDVLIRL